MIKHRFVSEVPDGSDPSVIQPSDWNDGHDAPCTCVPIVAGAVTWTNMPAAVTEFPGTYRTRVDLTYADEARIAFSLAVTGFAGSTIRLQYSLDQSAWVDLTDPVALSAVGAAVSAWTAIPAGAKADVFLRATGVGGNGVVDPQFRGINLQVK